MNKNYISAGCHCGDPLYPYEDEEREIKQSQRKGTGSENMKLEVKNLTKTFGEKEVLHGISFSIESGKALGLLGRNGAGKTTTIRILMDVFRANSGEILLDGSKFVPSRHRIGYLPEERGLYPKKTVSEQIIYLGMLRLLEEEVGEALAMRKPDGRKYEISIATGELAAPYIRKHLEAVRALYPGITGEVYAVRNDFFGTSITVSGLVTGQDLKKQLKGKHLGERLLIPCNMLRAGENVFLDDVTVEELEQYLGVPVQVVDPSGEDFVRAVTEEKIATKHKRRQIYEQADCSNCRTT